MTTMPLTAHLAAVRGILMQTNPGGEEVDLLAGVPWIQLGLAGIFAAAWITSVALHNRAINQGKLIALTTVEAERKQHERQLSDKDAEYTRMVELKDEQIAAALGVKDEWKTAHSVSEAARKEERVTTASAVEGSRAIEHFLTSIVPPRVADVTTSGDNGPKEVGR